MAAHGSKFVGFCSIKFFLFVTKKKNNQEKCWEVLGVGCH